MKKPITLLMAISLVGLSGCSSAKSYVQPKGVKIASGQFKTEVVSKLDALIYGDFAFLASEDAEDIKNDFVFTSVHTLESKMSATSASGIHKTMKQTENYSGTLKLDIDSNSLSYTTKSVEKMGYDKIATSEETKVTDVFFDSEYSYDNIEMFASGVTAATTLNFFLSAIEDFNDELSDFYGMALREDGDDLEGYVYKLGNTYTCYEEVDAGLMMPNAKGTIVRTTQVTIGKNYVSLYDSMAAKDVVQKDPDTGVTQKGKMYEASYYKFEAKKNVKLNAPDVSKYEII